MHEDYMKLAIEQARLAMAADEVPVGAVIILKGQIIASAYNLREAKQCATAHAEILAIEEACRILNTWRLEECVLYVTLEPCPMCAGAILQSRIETVVYGACDFKGGSIESCMKMYETKGFNHYPTVISGVLQPECQQLLKDFFKGKRAKR
ncbi:MAG: nucleoside deaminase [Erysipelotrichaceae bacterium]